MKKLLVGLSSLFVSLILSNTHTYAAGTDQCDVRCAQKSRCECTKLTNLNIDKLALNNTNIFTTGNSDKVITVFVDYSCAASRYLLKQLYYQAKANQFKLRVRPIDFFKQPLSKRVNQIIEALRTTYSDDKFRRFFEQYLALQKNSNISMADLQLIIQNEFGLNGGQIAVLGATDQTVNNNLLVNISDYQSLGYPSVLNSSYGSAGGPASVPISVLYNAQQGPNTSNVYLVGFETLNNALSDAGFNT